MSWNPRRFVQAAHDGGLGHDDPTLLWVAADAADRLRSASSHEVLHPTGKALPPNGIVIGLAKPLVTKRGEASVLWVHGLRDVANALIETRAAIGDPLPPGVVTHMKFETTVVWLIGRKDNTVASAPLDIRGCTWLGSAESLEYAVGELELFAESGVDPRRWELDGEDAPMVADLIRATWTLYNEPEEVEVTAATVTRGTVTTGKKRKTRDHDITIVDVRRRIAEPGSREVDPDREPVEHEFRWPVRGHWRRQPFGEGRTQRRRIWIDAQVRGPEDKPLKVRPRVSVIR
jgi:hypothetical protein